MDANITRRFKSLSEFHQVFDHPKPVHPMISLLDIRNTNISLDEPFTSFIVDYYKIALKEDVYGKAKYGQNYYDFGEGGLVFSAPNQVFERPTQTGKSGYVFMFHPDFLLTYPLAKSIKKYGFFSYAVNEALHLSEKEKATVTAIFKIIEDELNSRIDDFSQDLIISQIELLLNYSNRFYARQFITRKAASSELLVRLEDLLNDYYDKERSYELGVPTVHFLAEHLNMSASYLSDMLRSLTGQNAQQHIHNRLIEKAKELLSTTNQSVSEVAYRLGFEHPQSFSKLFKSKAKLSPLAFRQSFN